MAIHLHDSTDFEDSILAHILTISLNIAPTIVLRINDVRDLARKHAPTSSVITAKNNSVAKIQTCIIATKQFCPTRLVENEFLKKTIRLFANSIFYIYLCTQKQ